MYNGSGSGRHQPDSIPPRWLKCPRKSLQLIAGKFLAFKTPLDGKYDDQVPAEHRFPVRMLFDSMKGYKVKIGLWIDLCNTNRWYSKRDVEALDCKYIKVQCRGRGEAPTPEQVSAFVSVCRRFAQMNPLEVIGVHCTHGFNRSGFLVSSYLIETEDWSPEAAVTEFAFRRPPGIYKADYIEELFRRYGDVTDAPAVPHLPDWCNEEEDDGAVDDDGHSKPSEQPSEGASTDGGGGGGGGRRRREYRRKDPKFMEGVPGVSLVTQQPLLSDVQRKIQHLCGWRSRGFPGSQPVSLARENIHLLGKQKYKVSWKADGARYMMLIDGRDRIFFADRDNCIFKVSNLAFPDRKEPEKHLADTLVDGEMVIDEVGDQRFPRYLIYDVVAFKAMKVGKTDFGRRTLCINKEIVGNRAKLIAEGRIDRPSEPFSVRQKEFWDIHDTHKLLGPRFKKEALGHEPDGLIFQPDSEYLAGRDDNVLKWKPLSHNSVDFKLKIVKDQRPGMLAKNSGLLFVGGSETPVAEMKVTKELRELNNKIIECRFDFDTNSWAVMRERTDKSFPNSYKTAEAVMRSIREPVTEEMLIRFIDEHTRRLPAPPDPEFRPPPPKKRKT